MNVVLLLESSKANDKRAEEIKGNDPEIKAYRIKPSGNMNVVKFDVDIRVPRTLKWWYGMIVYLGFAFVAALLIIGVLLIVKGKQLTPVFAQVGISLVAAIIASRGWMMNDETVLKRVSLIMTGLAIGILVILISLFAVGAFLANPV